MEIKDPHVAASDDPQGAAENDAAADIAMTAEELDESEGASDNGHLSFHLGEEHGHDENIEKGPFEALGAIASIQRSLSAAGWEQPTPIQKLCLPEVLTSRDVVGFAQTGTGKTGVFLIAAAQDILKRRSQGDSGSKSPSAIVLAPTRELAIQIENDCKTLFADLGVLSIAVYGGADYDKQEAQLNDGVDIVIATPGRLKDFFEKGVLKVGRCRQFVCDEADRMFDMGFIEDVQFFLDKLPEKCQKLLFSATSNDHVKELAFEYLEHPSYLYANPETITPAKIAQKAFICESKDKLKVLLGMLREYNPECSVIFVNTKMVAEWLHFKLTKNGINADLITGDLPQKKRIALIGKIKKGKINALIATDVASRGLHISALTHVFNFDLPDEAANYIHRIGRTARAGSSGSAYSLVCEDYGQNLDAINVLLGDDLKLTAEWPNADYMEIKDEAPNPYKVERKGAERSARPAHSDERDDEDVADAAAEEAVHAGEEREARARRPRRGRDQEDDREDRGNRRERGEGRGRERGGRDRDRGGRDRDRGDREERGDGEGRGGQKRRSAGGQKRGGRQGGRSDGERRPQRERGGRQDRGGAEGRNRGRGQQSKGQKSQKFRQMPGQEPQKKDDSMMGVLGKFVRTIFGKK